MSPLVAFCEWLLRSWLSGLAIASLGIAGSLICRRPARKLRVLELTALGLVACPCVALVPVFLYRSSADRALQPRGAVVVRKAACLCNGVPHEHEVASPAPTRIAAAPTLGTVPIGLAVCYLLGATALAVRLAAGWAGLLRLRKRASAADARFGEILDRMRGRSRRVPVLLSPEVDSPITIGPIRTAIVLPASWGSWSAEEIEPALAHEWAHVLRSDLWIWQAINLARVLHWANPLVWRIRSVIRFRQDLLADAEAASRSESPLEYASFLISAASAIARRPSAACLSLGDRASHLSRRIEMLISWDQRALRRCGRTWSVAAGLIALAMTIGVASAPAPTRRAGDDVSQQPRPAPVEKSVIAKWVEPSFADRVECTLPNTVNPAFAAMTCPTDPKAVMAPVQAPPGPAPVINAAATFRAPTDSVAPTEPAEAPLKLSGRIVDEKTGAPVAGAEVVVTIQQANPLGCATYNNVMPTIAQSRSKTGNDGVYGFEVSADQANLSGWNANVLRVDVWHPTAYAPREGTSAPLRQAFQDKLFGRRAFYEEIRMTPAPNIVLTGGVFDAATDQPVSGAQIRIFAYDQSDPIHPDILTPIRGGDGNSTAVSRENGAFTFALPPSVTVNPKAVIRIELTHPTHYARARARGETIGEIRAKRESSQRPFYEHLTMTAAQGAHGRVVSPAGEPIANALVSVYAAAPGKDRYRPMAQVRTNAFGGFRAAPDQAGSRWMVAIMSGKSELVASRRAAIQGADGDAGDIVIPAGRSLRGVILDSAGAPVSGGVVQAEQLSDDEAESAAILDGSGLWVSRAQTDDRGRFELKNLPAGEYAITCVAQGTPRAPAIYLPAKATVGDATAELELKPVPAVVVEARTRGLRPAENATGKRPYAILRGTLGDRFWQARSEIGQDANRAAEFRVPLGLEDASIELVVDGAVRSGRSSLGLDEEPVSTHSRVVSLGTVTADIRDLWFDVNELPCNLTIKVRSNNGKLPERLELKGAYRACSEASGCDEAIEVFHRGGGVFTTEGLAADEPVTVSVSAPGRAVVRRTVLLNPGEARTLDIAIDE